MLVGEKVDMIHAKVKKMNYRVDDKQFAHTNTYWDIDILGFLSSRFSGCRWGRGAKLMLDFLKRSM